MHASMPPPDEGDTERCQVGGGQPYGSADPWLKPLATTFVWWTTKWMWAAPWVVFHQDDLSWWAFPFIVCACLVFASSESAFLVYFPCICVSVCFVVFLVHFRYISCTIPICPPAIGQTPKLVEIISSKVLCLSLVFIWAYFIWTLAVRIWSLRTANKLPHT